MLSLNATQQAILASTVKTNLSWRFDVDTNNDGTIDYRWSTKTATISGLAYTYKIVNFSSLTLAKGDPTTGFFPSSRITITVSNKDNTLIPANFEGADITISLVIDAGALSATMAAWKFRVRSACSVYQNIVFECEDWLSRYLEGDYPNTRLVSDLFPADIMAQDNACVPVVFGTPYIPLRWIIYNQAATYVDADTFTVSGDQTALFAAGQFLVAYCGADGARACWVDNSSYPASNCIKICRNGMDNPGMGQTITTEIGTTYQVDLWAKQGEEATILVTFGTSTRLWESGTSWGAMTSLTFTATSTSTSLSVTVMTGTGTNGAYIDGVQVRKVLGGGSFGSNLVTNGDFETDVSGWTPLDSATLTHSVGTGILLGTTTVNLTTASDDLTSNLAIVQTNHYLLGIDATYTIDQARSPREVNGKSTFPSASYTFKQDAIIGSDGLNYKVVQLIANDANGDGTYDANAVWGINEKSVHDVPFRYSRSVFSGKTNPADIVDFILKDWGIPAVQIDTTSQTAAAAIYTTNGLSLDVGFYYQMPRKELVAKLQTLAGLVILVRDKLYYRVLTKTSQSTISKADIIKDSFRSRSLISTQSQKDSGYLTWQDQTTDPIDQVNTNLIAVKSSTTNKSNTTIECEWVDGCAEAKKAAKLALQRSLLPAKEVIFSTKLTMLALEPGDMITINEDDYDAGGSSYDVQIEEISIVYDGKSKECHIDFRCTRFSDDLDDWADLSETDTTIYPADTSKGYAPIHQGPAATSDDEVNSNTITQVVEVAGGANLTIRGGGDLILKGSDTDPGKIKLQGTDYYNEIWANTTGNMMIIEPEEDAVVTCTIGYDILGGSQRFLDIKEYAERYIYLYAGENFGSSYDRAYLLLAGGSSPANAFARIRIDDAGDNDYQTYDFEYANFYPLRHKFSDFGLNTNAWDDAYADDWNNVADFFFLDHRDENGNIIPVDDLEVIKGIKGSGTFDQRTGFEIIDDDTLPDWLLTKNKKNKEIVRDPDGKPYLSLKAVDSLIMGAIRQLATQNEELAKKNKELADAIAELKAKIDGLQKK